MNHPKLDEWVPYLYGGLKSDARRQLKAHLGACAECRAEVERWQRSARRLTAWKLPRPTPNLAWLFPTLRWAAATAVVLATGFTIGRFTGTEAVASRVRAQLEPQLRQAAAQLARQEVQRTSAAMLQASAEQTEKLLAAYDTVNESRRTEDLQRLYVALKRQLDTVAINTESEFVQLASYHPPQPDATHP